MARKVGGPAAGQTRKYVPKAYDNRGAPEDERVVVWIDQPTEGDKRAAVASIEDAVSLDMEGESSSVRVDAKRVMRVRDELISRFVSKVANYEASDGTPIANGADLVKHGEPAFIQEIADEILGKLDMSTQEKKLFVEPSVSTEADTQASDGIALSAASRGSTRSEAVA